VKIGFMISYFISADWGKKPNKRAVWISDRNNRRIYKAETSSNWNLSELLKRAYSLSNKGPVLIGIDVVLGVPASYWRLVQQAYGFNPPQTFVQWLAMIEQTGGFFDTVTDPQKWSVSQPWFQVMKGPGGRTSFTNKVDDNMLRKIDHATGAKPVFAVSGIPGTVGSGTRELWKELAPLMQGIREFAIWPFEGDLESLLTTNRIVLCETYPALAYAAAVADKLPTERIRNSKSKRCWRNSLCGNLQIAKWIQDHEINLDNLDPARDCDDEFDACFVAAAVLRCLCEGRKITDRYWTNSVSEGSMLLLGSVDIPKGNGKHHSSASNLDGTDAPNSPHPFSEPDSARIEESNIFHCPIPGCTKKFIGSRGGWDGHVGSIRIHPDWKPEIKDPEQRRKAFRQDFSDWFD